MAKVIQKYLDGKYGEGGPDDERFAPDADEVHASQLSDCQRKRYWKHDRAYRAGSSPYFELGRVFEVMYGAALAFEYDPAVSRRTLANYKTWEVAEMSARVQQDVGVTIDLGDGVTITGECDWVVFETDLTFDEMVLREDGSRWAVVDGEEYSYPTDHVVKVVETKTKKDLSWLGREPDKKHQYQVYPYMKALNCDAEVAYMQRNDWEERILPVEMSEAEWMDCELRARQHSANMNGDEVPGTDPLDSDECRWCPFQDECRELGGSAWES